jgi:hypothetical protein
VGTRVSSEITILLAERKLMKAQIGKEISRRGSQVRILSAAPKLIRKTKQNMLF